MNEERGVLQPLIRAWNRRLITKWLLQAAAMGWMAAALQIWIRDTDPATLPGWALLFFLLLAPVRIWLSRTALAKPETMARHLDRKIPWFQDSAGLLVLSKQSLSPLQKLQRQRLTEKISGLHLQRPSVIGDLGYLVAALVFALMLPPITTAIFADPPDRSNQTAAGRETVTRSPKVLIQVEPPAYTSLPSRTQTNPDLEIPAGSQVSWQWTTQQPFDLARLSFSDEDQMQSSSTQGNRIVFSKKIEKGGYYQLNLTGPQDRSWESRYFQILVQPDQPPEVALLEPGVAHLQLDPEKGMVLHLEGEARDDFGIASAALHVTAARGSGEGVQFEEFQVDLLGPHHKPSTKTMIRHALDAREFGVGVGDELFVQLRVRDNREPVAGETRSHTLRLSIGDPPQAVTMLDGGLAVDLMPEFFRSQRQIIIDTERLLEDRAKISDQSFAKRAQDIGIDQKLLRLRYGRFLGEESDSGFGATSPEDHEDHDHEGPESGEDDPFAPGESVLDNPELADFVHQHDTQEEGTFFTDPVKQKLKRALGHMWNSERYLRSLQPDPSLPFQYKALGLLKEITRASRIYVQRVGFEAPPMDHEKLRLSGDLSEIQTRTTTLEPLTDEENILLRESLKQLAGMAQGNNLQPEHWNAVVRLLQKRAGEQPQTYLTALNLSQELMTQGRTKRSAIEEPLAPLQRALWNLLPKHHAFPSKQGNTSSKLGSIYFSELGNLP